MSSTTKKALIQRFDRDNLYGWLNISTYVTATGIEILTQAGAHIVVPYEEIKLVCFVREFEAQDPGERRVFTSRPKTPGLWVRFRFKDNDLMEGLLPNDLLGQEAYGFSFTPPDAGSNTQRVFVPKAALESLQVLAVMGSQPRRPQRQTKPVPKEQISLFDVENG
ncbi:MAG: hypothetical protein HYZ37_03655 [Candidatus Solibacter usitatus]|nr:hypothetical protein [Candidatus Solibacter usitatus]